MSHIVAPAVGAVLRIDTGVDLTGNTGLYIYVKKPDGTTATWTASIDTDTSFMTYTIQTGDLNQSGGYIISSAASWAGTDTLYGTAFVLDVKLLYEL